MVIKGAFTWTPQSESNAHSIRFVSVHMNPVNPMRIECALSPIHFQRWIGSGLKLDYIIIHKLREVTPTMSLWLSRWLGFL